ncbi:hypothetical protein [Bifidobacterium longum]|uniref:hypothetical protein n=1 Tax=Bifidobacterium longum TaxID=216816 RepID=UPI0018661044|nr:hypothetical protein [Bifidobacterium longum]QOL43382.1 hypothetical protein BL1343_10605 [Bifidobacterium longum subsp. longum]
MRQIRSALPRLSDRLGLRHAGHPVIAASCAVLSVAVLAEYVFSMAARVPGTATVRDIMLALAVLAGLVGGMFRPDRFLWPALVTGVILMLDVPMVTPDRRHARRRTRIPATARRIARRRQPGHGPHARGHRLARRTHTSASQPDTEQAHWQLEAVIPFTGVLQTMEW